MTAPAVPRTRPLVGLLTATGASVAANAMVAVLVPWLVLSRTGSPAQAGLVGAVAGVTPDIYARVRPFVCALPVS